MMGEQTKLCKTTKSIVGESKYWLKNLFQVFYQNTHYHNLLLNYLFTIKHLSKIFYCNSLSYHQNQQNICELRHKQSKHNP